MEDLKLRESPPQRLQLVDVLEEHLCIRRPEETCHTSRCVQLFHLNQVSNDWMRLLANAGKLPVISPGGKQGLAQLCTNMFEPPEDLPWLADQMSYCNRSPNAAFTQRQLKHNSAHIPQCTNFLINSHTTVQELQQMRLIRRTGDKAPPKRYTYITHLALRHTHTPTQVACQQPHPNHPIHTASAHAPVGYPAVAGYHAPWA